MNTQNNIDPFDEELFNARPSVPLTQAIENKLGKCGSMLLQSAAVLAFGYWVYGASPESAILAMIFGFTALAVMFAVFCSVLKSAASAATRRVASNMPDQMESRLIVAILTGKIRRMMACKKQNK